MSNTAITHLVLACAAVFGLAAFAWLIAVPAIQSYSRLWERMAAGFLSLYVLATLIVIGLAAGGAVIYYWPRVFG
ncbi:MAG: hypothetical protein U0T02_04570 [Solirubrobacteraceae bacterium]